MSAARAIAALITALAVFVVLSGCRGDGDSGGLDPIDATAIDEKLAQVEERAAEGRCTGDNSALSSLTSLQEFVASSSLDYVPDQTRSDLQELLGRLGAQIQSQCEQETDLTTSTTTTDTTETETTDTETETTTEKTTSTRETTDTTTRETTSPRPPQGGGQGGGGNAGSGGGGEGPKPPDSSGGIGPGAIRPPIPSGWREDARSVLPHEDDQPRAEAGKSR